MVEQFAHGAGYSDLVQDFKVAKKKCTGGTKLISDWVSRNSGDYSDHCWEKLGSVIDCGSHREQ